MQNTLSEEVIVFRQTVFNANLKMAIIKNCLFFFILAALVLYPHQRVSATALTDYLQQQHINEHKAILDLVPITAAKKQVVKSGFWSNPAIWTGGKLPKAGESVYVPADKALTVDIESDVSLKTVRVDGAIKFATNKNVRIKLDTIVVADTGSFEIGSENARVPANNKVEIIIAKNGPINRSWDPLNLSRGVIIQGKTRIFGADKSAFHKLAIAPGAGATQITLNKVPTGWRVGDTIAITATKFRNWLARQVTEDELRRIKAISGTTVILGQVDNPETPDPLKYSHISTIKNMPVFVSNLTRNIVISGEGGETTPVSQRGHFMVMHNPDAVIKGAGFYYLGRTDKSKPIDDYKLGADNWRLKDAKGQYIRGANNNPRGRYPVHFHHTGTDINVPPVICSGNAVFSSAGWGFVNHGSYVNIEDNASYNVYGAHYVTEDGNEMGTFKRNIAMKAVGRPTYIKFGQGNHDVGHTGHGFWLESRNMAMQDNVVSGVNNSGVAYWHRNEMPGMDLFIPRDNLLTPNKGLIKNMPTIHYEKIPITYEKNTTVLASFGALDVIKSSPKQNHDVRSVIQGFKAYSVVNGIGIQYTEKYILKDIEIIADPVATVPWYRGMFLMPQVKELVMVNANISGFLHPIATGTVFKGQPDQTEVTFVNTKVDGRPINPGKDLHTVANAVKTNYNPKFQRIATVPANMIIPGASVQSKGGLSFKSASSLSGNFPASYNSGYVFKGTKVDSLGSLPYESAWGYYQLMNSIKKGYYTDSAGNKYVLIKDLISDRLTGATLEITAKLKLTLKYKELGPLLGSVPG